MELLKYQYGKIINLSILVLILFLFGCKSNESVEIRYMKVYAFSELNNISYGTISYKIYNTPVDKLSEIDIDLIINGTFDDSFLQLKNNNYNKYVKFLYDCFNSDNWSLRNWSSEVLKKEDYRKLNSYFPIPKSTEQYSRWEEIRKFHTGFAMHHIDGKINYEDFGNWPKRNSLLIENESFLIPAGKRIYIGNNNFVNFVDDNMNPILDFPFMLPIDK